MAIDDPISAVQALNASDERQRLVLPGLAKDFIRILKLFAPGVAVPMTALEGALDWLSRRQQANRAEFVDVLAEELKYRGAQIDALIAASEEHRRFMNDEMPGLVVQTLRKAEEIRSKARVAHLARILVHAAEVGPHHGADLAEEMTRIAMEMSEVDIVVLRAIHDAFAKHLEGSFRGKTSRLDVLQLWRFGVMSRLNGTQGEILSICLKLESYGLVERIEDRSKNNLDDEPLAFGLLQKGKDFVDYIRSSVSSALGGNGRADQSTGNRGTPVLAFDISGRIARFKTEWNLIKNFPTGIQRAQQILRDLYTLLIDILTEVSEGRNPTAEVLVRSALEQVGSLKDTPLAHGMVAEFWKRGDVIFDLLSREALAKPASQA